MFASNKPNFLFFLGEGLLCLLLGGIALAQLPTATISGVVKDSSGGVIPNASVTVANTETGLSRTTVTANNGSYRFPALPVGTYEVRAEQSGFRTHVQSGLRITVGEEAVLNFTLDVGAVTETVSVTAEAPIVNTTSGSLSGLVSEQRVSDLPLDGRNYNDLSLLQTGVSQVRSVTQSGFSHGTYFSSNGAPIRSNTFMIDGTIMNSLDNTGAASVGDNTLGVEGIREFRVVTNAFSAEYGMNMGSQVTLVTKGGTNNLHGSVFEFLRNSALDARNWTDIPDKPSFRRNNFGAAMGGPIQHDKTFFFLTYEGLRQGRGVTRVGTVPTLAARQDGGLVPRIAESVKPYLAFYPAPNGPDLGQGIARYFNPVTDMQRQDFGQARGDYNFSTSDSFFVRYTMDDAFKLTPAIIPPTDDFETSRNQWLTLSENHIFTPVLLNTFRASYSRTHTVSSSFPLEAPGLSFVQGEAVGGLGISGVSGIGASRGSPWLDGLQRIISFSDDVFYTRGRHSLKFGTLINKFQQFMLVTTNLRGGWSFANLAAFLEARPTQFAVVTPGSRLDRTYDYSTLGFYVQDDLRVASNFTLNLGLRYEFMTGMEEVKGNGAAVRDIQHDAAVTPGPPFLNPSLRNLSPRFGFAWDVTGDGKTALRGGFGLLYDIGTLGAALVVGTTGTPPLSSLTTIPGTYAGLTFGPLPNIPSQFAGKALRTVDYRMQQPHLLSYNLTLERQLPFDMGFTLAYGGSRGINIMQNGEGNPTVPQGIPEGRTRCLTSSQPPAFNPTGPKCWTGTDPRTNPNWQNVEYKTAGSSSWYNSLQVGLNKRLGRGLQFQSSYTWSHLIDFTQGQFGTDDTVGNNWRDDPTNRQHDKGSSQFDLRHNWRFNAIYRLPSAMEGGWGKLLNGWWISGILTWHSGMPFSAVLATQRSRSGVGGPNGGPRRADLVPGVKHEDITRGVSRGCTGIPAGTPLGTPDLFYDPCAFAIPPLGFLGNAGRNIFYGPNLSNLNFSLVKDTPLPFLGESGTIQFRAEFFNILNHPSFAPPDLTVYTARADVEPPRSTAGDITGTLSLSREIQFALKIIF